MKLLSLICFRVLFAVMLALPAAQAAAANALIALDASNHLLRFNSASPNAVTSFGVTGLGANESLVGIDYRPATGRLYGLTKDTSNVGRLYVIEPSSGAAYFAVQLTADPGDTSDGNPPYTTLSGTEFGIDFHPAADRLRIVTDTGKNLRVNVDNGFVLTDGDFNPVGSTVMGAAYINSFAGASTTTLYDIDIVGDRLMIQNPPNNGALGSVGALGVDATSADFDIVSTRTPSGTITNVAYAALTIGGAPSLFAINLSTGAATTLGSIGFVGFPLRGLTAEMSPPSAIAYAITPTHNLIRFEVETPAAPANIGLITGLGAGESIIGMDFRTQTNALFLFTKDLLDAGRAYRLDVNNATATFLGKLEPDPGDASDPYTGLSGTDFGVDYHPMSDRLRIVSNAGQNLRVSLSSFLVTTDTPLDGVTTSSSAVAYSNNFEGSTSNTLYAIDSVTDQLCIQDPPNSGTLAPIGPLGVNIGAVNGFDIGTTGDAFATLSVGGAASLYRINLTTGAATLVGAVGSGNASTLGFATSPAGSLYITIPDQIVNENAGTATLSIARVGGNIGNVTLLVDTVDGSAEAGSDYSPLSRAFVILSGNSLPAIHVPIINDAIGEGTETFTVHVSGVSVAATKPGGDTATFTIPGAELAVEQPIATPRLDGATIDFGSVGIATGIVEKVFTLRNTGTQNLVVSSLTIDGSGGTSFSVSASPATIAPNGTGDFTVTAMPKAKQPLTAALHIVTNDTDESPFTMNLTAIGVTAVTPAVTTKAATGILFDSVTANATVNARGALREVFFDYGTTAALGSTVFAGSVSQNIVEPVSVTLPNLLPHTKYFFRARVVGAFGSVTGTQLSFTTLDHSPVAVNDSAIALPSAKITIPVVANDTDVDGDTLSVASFTQPGAGAGTVAKVGENLVFTPSATFNGGSFTYKAKDAFGGASASATVTLVPGTCTLGPTPSISSDSSGYSIGVTANAPWAIVETLPWLSFTPPLPSDLVAQFIVSPNPSINPRTGTVKIGGQTHTVTQAGIAAAPILSQPSPLPKAAISAFYDIAIPTQNGPVTYTAKNLPAGMALSNTTGHITGYPTTAKTYQVSITAKNAKGTSAPIDFDIEVLRFPISLVGSYSATVSDDDLTDHLGGLLTMTVTGTGGVTGTLKIGAGSHGFTGRLNTAVDPLTPDPHHPELRATVTRTGKSPVSLSLSLDSATELISGAVTAPIATSALINGSRHVWTVANPASDYKGTLYTTSLLPVDFLDTSIPQGIGYLTFSVSNLGAISWSGQLADGTVIATTTATLWKNGQFPLFVSLYGGKGSLNQALTIAPISRIVTGVPHWIKQAQPASVRAYAAGFGPAELDLIAGSLYTPPAPGNALFNIPAPGTATIDFLSGNIDGVEQFASLDQTFTISATRVTAFNTAPAVNPAGVKLTKLDVAKGIFAGTMTLKDTNPFNNALPKVSRTVNFSGVLLPHYENGLGIGIGYFLLPSISGPPANTINSPLISGRVRILP